ncbi:MAG TPA: tRNA lysidine(34) synthetase TilS, partial [bacterium]|nr:tRNA lysidine(34) synthetase TilS [bacterium]
MLDRVVRTIESHAMLTHGDAVVLAVSGGADSMAMLQLFAALRARWALRLHVAHLDHGLRPEAGEDAAFVQAAAAAFGVPVTVERADVRSLAAREKRSLEEAGRLARYDFFRRVAAAVGARVVATAHTRDDQIETVLMALLAGGPWEMLAGIPPLRPLGEATVIRPLRDVRREETAAYLRQAGVRWRDDPTNGDRRLRRNWIRWAVLPALRERQPDLPAALWALGEAAREVDRVLGRLTVARDGQTARREDHAVHAPRAAFQALPAPLRRRWLAAAATEVGGTARPITRVLLERALGVAERGRVGEEVPVGGALLRVGYDRLELVPAAPPAVAAEYRLPVPGAVHAAAFGLIVSAELIDGAAVGGTGPDEAVFDLSALALP